MLNISKYNAVFLCFFINICTSCNFKEKTQIKKTKIKDEKVVTKAVKKIITKETDTINKNNAVNFLKAYGKLNKETLVLYKTRLGDIKIKLYNIFIFYNNV